MNTQKLEQVPIDKLVPYARNARTHSKEQIAQLRASLREFGFVSPAVIDADYNILVGHGRITAAREEGYETVPCVFAENLTEAQKRAYILADNQLALNAGWDEEMLSVELSDLQDQSFDLSLLGFDAGELDKLLGTGMKRTSPMMTLTSPLPLRRLPSWSPATSGRSASIESCVAMPPRRKMWKSSWTARKQTSS
jgi:ParB-like chromosome segregation protein Spo0J